MNKKLDYLFKELVNEAACGKLTFETERYGNWIYNSQFFSEIENQSNNHNNLSPVLKVHDYKHLINQLEEYINIASRIYYEEKQEDDLTEDGFHKFLMYMLIANCSNYDLENFSSFVEKRTQILKNKEHNKKINLPYLNNHKFTVAICDTPSNLEAPNKFTPVLKNEDGSRFVLPSITYGFYDDKAYIGAIQGLKGKQTNEASRKMDRYFRKLNNGVNMEEIEGNVSPNAVASLTIFNAYLKSKNINKIVAPCFLPVRAETPRRSLLVKSQKNPDSYNEEWLNLRLDEKDKEQFNATNKFMYLFKRYCYHFTDSDCWFDDHKQEMQTILNKQTKTSDNIIFNLDKICLEGFIDNQKDKL